MKKLFLLFAIAIALSTSSVAVAGVSNGNGMVVTKYATSYVDPYFGPVSISGTHQVKSGKGATFNQDSFTATSTTGLPLTNAYSGELLTLWTGPLLYGWASDYNGFSQAVSFTGQVSLDGMSYTAIATY